MKLNNLVFCMPLANEEKTLNGFQDEKHNLAVIVKQVSPENILSRKVFAKLVYNYPEDKLYLAASVVSKPLNEEEIKKLEASLEIQVGNILLQFSTSKMPDLKLEPGTGKNLFYVEPIKTPKGYKILESEIKTEKDHLMYEEFCSNEFAVKEVYHMCTSRLMPMNKFDGKNIMTMPVHKKDNSTGVLFVADFIVPAFRRYQLAMNFIKGFPEDSAEFQIGKLMLLRREFSEFVIGLTNSVKGMDEQEVAVKIMTKAQNILKKKKISDSEEKMLNNIKQ
jgi:hypothetical protein